MPPAPLADRVLRVARAYVEKQLPPDPRGDRAELDLSGLLITYGTWRGRFIPQRPRTVHLSKELTKELRRGSPHAAAVQAVRGEFETGADLTPRLSTDVLVAWTPTKKQARRGRESERHVDVALAHDGLHHLHLGTGSGAFVPRTDDLLFVVLRDEDVYFVGVYPHAAWGRLDLLKRIVGNWPDAGILRGSKGLRLVRQVSDDERWDLMKAGVNVLVEIGGAVYMCPGQTGARTPIDVTRRVNALLHEVRRLDEEGLRSWLPSVDPNADPSRYWSPTVRDEHVGLESSQKFVRLGRLA